MPDEKYLSKWSGENIDRAYEVIKDLNIGDMNKLTYVDSNGNLKATSFTKEKIGLLDTVSWSAKPSNNFVIKNENGNIALSNYNYYSFVGYWDSGAATGPEQCLSSFYTETSGSITKYYVQNTGITTLQLRTAFSDIEDLKAAIGGGGETDLTSRVAALEGTTSILTTDVFNIKNQIGTSSQEGSILYRLAQIDNTLTTKANTSDVNAALATKADISYVDTALATKANTSDVNTALAAKADTSYVNTALATKANTSDVTTALAAKQNVIDNNNMLNADLVDDTTSTHKFATQAQLNQIQTNTNELADTRILRYTQSNIRYGQYFSPPVGDLAHITLYHEPVIVLNELRYYYSEYKMVEGMGNCFIYTSELLYNQNGFYYKNMLIVNRSQNRIYYDMYLGDSTGIPSNDIVEFSSNKVTSLSASSTDYQYPSAKCVYDYISGTDDGTNWTSLTIGNTTKAIPTGGGGGTTVSGTNDGTNWTTITISGSTYNIPNNGSVTISQVQVNDPAKVPSSALMYSVNSRVVELETQLAAALQEINSLKQRVSAIEGDYVVAMDDHTEVEVSGNNIKFISDVTTSGNEISFTQSSTHLDGNDILL